MARLIDADALNRKKKYSFQTVGGCFPKSEWFIKLDDLFNAPTVDAVQVKELEQILNTTQGLELWDYQRRGIMSAVYRLCGKEKNDE